MTFGWTQNSKGKGRIGLLLPRGTTYNRGSNIQTLARSFAVQWPMNCSRRYHQLDTVLVVCIVWKLANHRPAQQVFSGSTPTTGNTGTSTTNNHNNNKCAHLNIFHPPRHLPPHDTSSHVYIVVLLVYANDMQPAGKLQILLLGHGTKLLCAKIGYPCACREIVPELAEMRWAALCAYGISLKLLLRAWFTCLIDAKLLLVCRRPYHGCDWSLFSIHMNKTKWALFLFSF